MQILYEANKSVLVANNQNKAKQQQKGENQKLNGHEINENRLRTP